MKYKLIVKNHITGEEISYPIVGSKGLEKQEARLSEIDLFLLCGLGKGFKDKNDFLNTLNKLYEDISDYDDVFIKYENRGTKKAPALFGYNSILNYIAHVVEKSHVEKDKNIILDNKIFKEIKAGFYEGIKDDNYFNLIIKMRFSEIYLNAIETMRRLEETYSQAETLDKEEAKKILDKMLENYKNLRKIILAHKEYNKKYDQILGPDHRFAESELEKIAILAEEATVNIIENFKVIDKKYMTLPEKLINIIECANNKCISNKQIILLSLYYFSFKIIQLLIQCLFYSLLSDLY